MRPAVLALAASILMLTGCGEAETTGNTAAVDEAVTAEDFATNDTTAIDAATGADANMAADVDINFTGSDPDNGSGAAAMTRAPSRRLPPPGETNAAAPSNETLAPAPQPATPPADVNTN